jgi:hypothetical protein
MGEAAAAATCRAAAGFLPPPRTWGKDTIADPITTPSPVQQAEGDTDHQFDKYGGPGWDGAALRMLAAVEQTTCNARSGFASTPSLVILTAISTETVGMFIEPGAALHAAPVFRDIVASVAIIRRCRTRWFLPMRRTGKEAAVCIRHGASSGRPMGGAARGQVIEIATAGRLHARQADCPPVMTHHRSHEEMKHRRFFVGRR